VSGQRCIKRWRRRAFSSPSATTADYLEINRSAWTKFEKGILDSNAVQRVRFEKILRPIWGGNPAEGPALKRPVRRQSRATAIVTERRAEMLERLKNANGIAVVTNGLHLVQRARLERSGFLP
jgi:hypothetical protein